MGKGGGGLGSRDLVGGSVLLEQFREQVVKGGSWRGEEFFLLVCSQDRRTWISSGGAGRSKSGAEVRCERGGAAGEDGSERASLDTSQSFRGSHRLFAGGGLLQTLL